MTISLRKSIMLLLGTALLLTLFIGGAGSFLLLRNSKEITAQYNHIVRPAFYVAEIKSNCWRAHALMLQIALDQEPARIESNQTILLELLAKNEELMERYKAAASPERQSSKQFQAFEMKRRRYLDTLTAAMELNLKTTSDEAIQAFNHYNYQVLLPQFNDFVISLDRLGEFSILESRSSSKRNAAMLVTSITLVWLIILASIAILLVCGYLLSKRLMHAANRVTGFAHAIAEGDFNSRLEPALLERADEFGAIGRALEKMKKNLAETIGSLNATAENLAASGTHKSVFLSRMSHAIRTSLNAIIGMSYRAKKSPDQNVVRDSLDKIATSSTHLLGLVNDVLDMSKIEAGKFDLMEDEFSLEKVLMSVCTVISVKTEEKSQKFNVNILSGLPGFFIGDSLRLSQVLTNILSNASKYTPDNGEIALTASCLENSGESSLLRFVVEDNGIGLTEEQRLRLFTPFERADSGITRQPDGAGLGLAICDRIVRLMGGDIKVESEFGLGSRFIIEVRLKNSPRSAQPLLGKDIDPAALKVMLISADKQLRAFFENLLGELHVPLLCARDANDATTLLETEQGQFSAVFMDWPNAASAPGHTDRLGPTGSPGQPGLSESSGLPGTPGLPSLLVSSGSPETSNVPGPQPDCAACARFMQAARKRGTAANIIAMGTGARLADTEAAARQAGVTRFIPKPVFPATIADILNQSAAVHTQNQHAAHSGADFSGKRLLLVEDIDINREIVAAYLENTGIRIDEAVNGAQAVDKYLENHAAYDLIFMDVQMPVMDGYTATKRIRAEEKQRGWPRSVIVAMTANAFREDMEKCLEAGMDAHLAKPMSADATLALLKMYLQKD